MITQTLDEYGTDRFLPRAPLDLIEGRTELDTPEDEVRALITVLLATGYDDNDAYAVVVDPERALAGRYAKRHRNADDGIMNVVISVSETVDPRGIDAISPTPVDLRFDLDHHDELIALSKAISDGKCAVYQESESMFLVRS